MLGALVEMISLRESALALMILFYEMPRFNSFCCLWKFKSDLPRLSGKMS